MIIVDKNPDTAATFEFDNSYSRLPEHFYARLNPMPVRKPRMMKFNHALAEGRFGMDQSQRCVQGHAGRGPDHAFGPAAFIEPHATDTRRHGLRQHRGDAD